MPDAPRYAIKVLKSEADYDAALARVEAMESARPGTPEGDELEVLVALIGLYEDEHYPVGPPDPIEAIKSRMEQQGLTQKDLIPYIGSRSKVSEVLSGRRPLSVRMMRALQRGLGIPAQVLLG